MQERTPEIHWDIFLAHSSQDKEQALGLANALTSRCKVYIDRLQLKPGNTWAKKLQEAQKHSRITIALIGKATYEDAFFLKEEVLRAIDLFRRGSHLLIPVYLDGWMNPPPYGLMILQGISVPDEGGMDTVALRVLEMLQNHGPSAPVFQTVHRKDIQKVNDLLNILFPDGDAARILRGQLSRFVGVHAFGPNHHDRWRNTLKAFLELCGSGLKPVLETAWALHSGHQGFAPFLVKESTTPCKSAD